MTTSLFISTLILLHPQLQSTWKLAKANWTTFSSKASSDLGRNPNDLEDPIEHFTDIITNIANNTIPKSKPRSKNVILFG